MYLTQNLRRSMQQTPSGIISIFEGRQRSFAEFGQRIARYAGALHKLGLQPGDRVSMLALNSDAYLEYYLGTYWAGGVVNPLNTRLALPEIVFMLNDCGSRFLVIDRHFLELVGPLRDQCPQLQAVICVGEDVAQAAGVLSYESLIAESEPVEDAMRRGDDLAGIYYTSGTTGRPKGAMLTHANIFTNSVGMVAEGAVGLGCVGLHSAPMFHLADGAFMNAMLAAGGCHVIVAQFDPVAVLEVIQRERIRDMLLVPTMIQMLVDHPKRAEYDLSSVQSIIYGASPIAEALLDRAMAAFPKADFTQAYGQTELSPVATLLSADMHREAGRKLGLHKSNGRAAIGSEVIVADGNDQELPRGEVGEILVRGPGVMKGYWNLPEETAAALRGGWMHTGDAGYMDAHGYVFLQDRVKDMIISGGENVYSIEVENAVALHPAVAQCAVVGIPSERWGEAVHAFVVCKPGQEATAEDIIAHCKQRIAGYKCPRSVDFIEAMPLSGAGKILKRQLRAPYWEGHDRQVA